MMARGKPSLAEAIEAAQARAVELDALVVEWREREKAAVQKAVREAPGTNAYEFGSAPKKARAAWQKALQDREMLQIELDALAIERARQTANEADEALQAAIKDLGQHRPALEDLYRQAGEHVAAIAELWPAVKGHLESFDSKASNGRGLAAAAITNLDAQGEWNAAADALNGLGPLPCNLAYWIETVLGAALDPTHASDEYRTNTLRADIGIADVSAFNLTANFSGQHGKRGGSDFADRVQMLATRNEPEPERPTPSPEQLANEAARAAEVERVFQAHRARKQQDAILATWPQHGTANVAVDPDADPSSPDGLKLTVKERRELAELQTR